MNLTNLPNELLIPIIERINKPQDLYNTLIAGDKNLKELILRDTENNRDNKFKNKLIPIAALNGKIEIKYQGYYERQKDQVQRVKRLEKKRIPDSIDYHGITALSREAREKLDQIRPVSMGHAARISGVSPADLSILSLFIEKGRSSRSVPRGTD